MSDSSAPKPGDRVIDASKLELVKVTPEAISSYIKFHNDANLAMANIERLKPEEIQRAGINEKVVEELIKLIGDYRQADKLYPAAEELTVMLRQTKLERANRISQRFGEVASQARRRAEHDPDGAEILGPLEDLLKYQYGPAKKAAKTAKARSAKNAPPEGNPAQ